MADQQNHSSDHDRAAATSLTAADRARLVAVLGRLGSEHVGERAAAGLLASRMLHDKGLGWDEVLAPSAPAVEDTWRQQAIEAARYPGLLTPWEREFVRRLVAFPKISPKQAVTLARIVAKVRGRS
jgi:hypothetical protein